MTADHPPARKLAPGVQLRIPDLSSDVSSRDIALREVSIAPDRETLRIVVLFRPPTVGRRVVLAVKPSGWDPNFEMEAERIGPAKEAGFERWACSVPFGTLMNVEGTCIHLSVSSDGALRAVDDNGGRGYQVDFIRPGPTTPAPAPQPQPSSTSVVPVSKPSKSSRRRANLAARAAAPSTFSPATAPASHAPPVQVAVAPKPSTASSAKPPAPLPVASTSSAPPTDLPPVNMPVTVWSSDPPSWRGTSGGGTSGGVEPSKLTDVAELRKLLADAQWERKLAELARDGAEEGRRRAENEARTHASTIMASEAQAELDDVKLMRSAELMSALSGLDEARAECDRLSARLADVEDAHDEELRALRETHAAQIAEVEANFFAMMADDLGVSRPKRGGGPRCAAAPSTMLRLCSAPDEVVQLRAENERLRAELQGACHASDRG